MEREEKHLNLLYEDINLLLNQTLTLKENYSTISLVNIHTKNFNSILAIKSNKA
jgi:hypothetical protein